MSRITKVIMKCDLCNRTKDMSTTPKSISEWCKVHNWLIVIDVQRTYHICDLCIAGVRLAFTKEE